MKKILFSTIYTIFLMSNSIYAETVKITDTNKTMSNDEFMNKMMALEQREKDAKAKTVQVQRKLEETIKLKKTVDELAGKLGIKD